MEYDIDSAGEAQGGDYLSQWRPEEKIEIVKYAQIHTPKLASERFGVKLSTIFHWMKTVASPTVSAADVSMYLNSPFLGGTLQQGQMDTLPSHMVAAEPVSPVDHRQGEKHPASIPESGQLSPAPVTPSLPGSEGGSDVLSSPSELLAP